MQCEELYNFEIYNLPCLYISYGWGSGPSMKLHYHLHTQGPINPWDVATPTFSLLSFLLTMMAVMCWSMKNKMVARRAGMMAAAGAQDGRS